MGGSAFASGDDPLYTPRMPADVYETVRDRCLATLLHLYHCAASPIDGPGKADHGDIDILLALPKTASTPSSNDDEIGRIAKALGAERVISLRGNGCAANLAIPWPHELDLYRSHNEKCPPQASDPPCCCDQSPEPSARHASGQAAGHAARHIQVDVRVCASLEQWHWALFSHAHGDLHNILGTMLRPLGLTVSEAGLCLRIPEIEEHDRKRARVLLSHEPAEVLAFLGLPPGDDTCWDGPFESLRAMYEYAARCRFMHAPARGETGEGRQGQGQGLELKANDRRRMASRPAFRKWVEEFLPECREQGRFIELRVTREQVRQEAFALFHVDEEYRRRRDEFLVERQRDHIWNHTIKDNVPKKKNPSPADSLYRSCLVKALKRIILEDDASYNVLPGESLRDARGWFLMDKVLEFVLNRQSEVGVAAMERYHVRSAERMREKANRSQASV
ncbi:hypothetical protein ESCO_002013 [Escovopsis weberi]|uniref:Uncharacterized protein n=1 Tax=Escovopsis weberi TaxID=150374 RepID=A0A0M9VW85_ESCWE|nr:hypothetical protein ESCO_002013 [Escovopsis weberi]